MHTFWTCQQFHQKCCRSVKSVTFMTIVAFAVFADQDQVAQNMQPYLRSKLYAWVKLCRQKQL